MLWRSHFTPTPALTAQGRHVHGRCNPGRPRATWRRTFINHLPTLDVARDEAEAAAAGRLCSYSTQVLCAVCSSCVSFILSSVFNLFIFSRFTFSCNANSKAVHVCDMSDASVSKPPTFWLADEPLGHLNTQRLVMCSYHECVNSHVAPTRRRISLSQSLLVLLSSSWCWWWADRSSAALAWQACWADVSASSAFLFAPLSSRISCWKRQRSASQLLLASSTSPSRALLTWIAWEQRANGVLWR